MERPKTEREFMKRIRAIATVNDDVSPECRSCSEPFNSAYSTLTEGHCVDCARELFYDNIKPAVEGILEMNDTVACNKNRAFNAQVPRQRYGIGQTSS